MTKLAEFAGVDDVPLDGADLFLEALSPRSSHWKDDAGGWVFRGQAQADWVLAPTAMRSPDVFREFGIDGPSTNWSERIDRLTQLLDDFRDRLNQAGQAIPTEAPSVYWQNKYYSGAEPKPEAFPLMALAQHHGLPTVLLDWSRKAWFAAYFAAIDAASPGKFPADSLLAVWCLDRGQFSDDEDQQIFYHAPGGTNPNMSAQAGLFTRSRPNDDNVDRALHEQLNDGRITSPTIPNLRRFTLPVSEAPRLLRLLALEGITGLSMFPGTDGAVRAMRERTLWDKPERVLPGRRPRS